MVLEVHKNLKIELRRVLGIAAVSGVVGVLTGWLLPSLLFGVLAYLGWHLYHLAGLPDLLRQGTEPGPHLYTGLWKNVLQEIHIERAAARDRERNLASTLKRFRESVSALPEAVILLGNEGKVEWCNPAAGTLLGIVWPDASGKSFSGLARDLVLNEYLDRGAFAQPLVLTSPANRTKILSLYVTDLGENPEQRMIVASDISRQYHLESARRDFMANISHELRTPLTVVGGLLEQTTMAGTDAATIKRANELMQQQVGRMSELITDLLTLSRLELNDNPPGEERISIPDLASTIVEEARALSGVSNHALQLDIESPADLRGDARELRTAFSNLVTNAVRHTPDRSEIRVRWTVDDTGAHFSVTDTGEGIAARHLPRLTERLYRVEASRSRDTGGTGLGLAIVKHVLERHGAELEMISSAGRGSTFTCHFPAARIIM